MTVKHAPATPLPWHKVGQNGDPRNVNSAKGARICRASVFRDAEYLAHAANAYPRLVKELRLTAPALRARGAYDSYDHAERLLSELGESE